MIRNLSFLMTFIACECLAEAPDALQSHTSLNRYQLSAASPLVYKTPEKSPIHAIEESRSHHHLSPVRQKKMPTQKGLSVSTQTIYGNIHEKRAKILIRAPFDACDGSDPEINQGNTVTCMPYALKSLAPTDRSLGEQLTSLYLESDMSETSLEAIQSAVVLLSLSGNLKKSYQFSKRNDDSTNTFWYILSEVGSITDLYIYTIKESPEAIQALPIRTKKKMIDRLMRSSAPNIAQKWFTGNLSASMRSRYIKYLISEKSFTNPDSTDATTGYLISMANQRSGNIAESFKWLHERDFPPELLYSEKLLGNPQSEDPTAWGEVSRMIEIPDDISKMPQLMASRRLIDHSEAMRQSLSSLMVETNQDVKSQGSQFEFSD